MRWRWGRVAEGARHPVELGGQVRGGAEGCETWVGKGCGGASPMWTGGRRVAATEPAGQRAGGGRVQRGVEGRPVPVRPFPKGMVQKERPAEVVDHAAALTEA